MLDVWDHLPGPSAFLNHRTVANHVALQLLGQPSEDQAAVVEKMLLT